MPGFNVLKSTNQDELVMCDKLISSAMVIFVLCIVIQLKKLDISFFLLSLPSSSLLLPSFVLLPRMFFI